ncbi:MAG: hypothetical protein IPM61_02435 [Chlorobi bacterium]|nr:hypothetical protein [Chlorobiota bacterium]MBX7217656.1 hypothetical protein [Candidatus Kapabacteria bacterium]
MLGKNAMVGMNIGSAAKRLSKKRRDEAGSAVIERGAVRTTQWSPQRKKKSDGSGQWHKTITNG